MTQIQAYTGEFTIPASASFGVGSNVFTLTANTACHIRGYDSEGTGVCELIQAAIRGDGTGQGNANVELNVTTDKVQLILNAASNVTIDSSWLANTIGFTDSDRASGAEHYADKRPRYYWRPNKGLSDHPGDVNIWWAPRSTSKTTRSVDGTVYTTQGNLVYDGVYGYRHLTANVVRSTHETHKESLEEFWKDVVHPGRKVRAYFDRNCYNSNGYAEGYIVPADSEDGEPTTAGSFADMRGPTIRPWHSLWDVQFRMVKHV